MPSTMRIALVAGEPSGDQLGAGLIRQLRQEYPQATFYGIGGPMMKAAGLDALYEMEDISMIGLEGVFTRLPGIIRVRRRLIRKLGAEKPDVFVGIDVPDFNLGLELKLAQKSIPCIHYVSPTIWAWRSFRIRTIKRAVSHMLVLFPFELDIYNAYGVPATFVGHPIADEVDTVPDQAACRREFGIESNRQVIALLPGSRHSEIVRHARLFLETARKVSHDKPQAQFLLSAINDKAGADFDRLVNEEFSGLPVRIVTGHVRKLISASDLVLAASGTVTLEAALMAKPLVVAYKVSRISEWMVRLFAKVDKYAMPNFLLDSPDIPEFVQQRANADNLSRALLEYLDNRDRMIDITNKIKEIKIKLKVNSNIRAANAVHRFLQQRGS